MLKVKILLLYSVLISSIFFGRAILLLKEFHANKEHCHQHCHQYCQHLNSLKLSLAIPAQISWKFHAMSLVLLQLLQVHLLQFHFGWFSWLFLESSCFWLLFSALSSIWRRMLSGSIGSKTKTKTRKFLNLILVSDLIIWLLVQHFILKSP